MNSEKAQTENNSTEKSLSGFLDFARENGVRISTSEWLNYLGVIEEIGKDREILSGDLFDVLKSTGMATLVKDKADLAIFSDSFDEYFRDLKIARDEKEKNEKQAVKEFGKKMLELSSKNSTDIIKDVRVDANIDTDIYSSDNEDTNTDNNLNDDTDTNTDINSNDNAEINTDNDIDTDVTEREMKEQLGIEEVAPNDLDDDDHDDSEMVHGGQHDQHNDVLSKQNKNKKGSNKDNNIRLEKKHIEETTRGLYAEGGIGHSGDGVQIERKEFGVIGNMGGKGKYDRATGVLAQTALKRTIYEDNIKRRELSDAVRKKDRRERYNVRPDRTDVYEIVKNLRRIITDTSQMATGRLDVNSTIEHFAKKEFKFDYESEREVRPETVLFIDVGGPVDEWRPLMEELSKGMSRGLLKLEMYLFHNQLYGYCWDPKDGNYARPNGLKNVRDIVKKRKKVIIYGDADMAYSEVENDNYPPSDNEERIRRYKMGGLECLSYIKKNSDNVVWINPKFKSSWYYDPYCDEYVTDNSVGRISGVIPMYDLSIGGVQDAITELMKK